MSEQDFERGYVIACANIANLHNEPTIAADVMAQLGISWTDVKRLGLGEYDMQALRKIKAEHSREPFLPGRRTLTGGEGQ